MKHVVLFSLKEDIVPAEKRRIMEEFKAGIEALPKVIPSIRAIEVGYNENPDEKFDLALVGEFDSLEDIQAYAVNPAHVAVAGKLKPYVKSRACSDF